MSTAFILPYEEAHQLKTVTAKLDVGTLRPSVDTSQTQEGNSDLKQDKLVTVCPGILFGRGKAF